MGPGHDVIGAHEIVAAPVDRDLSSREEDLLLEIILAILPWLDEEGTSRLEQKLKGIQFCPPPRVFPYKLS